MASIGNLQWLQAGAGLIQMLGGFVGAAGAREEGESARAMLEFQARQAEQNAGTAVAIAQRQAEEAKRQGRYVASRALAVLAASGGGASDPGAVRILANAEAEGAYRAQMAVYEGESRARALRMEAAAARASGQNAVVSAASRANAMLIGGASRGLSGSMSLYQRYGGNGPSGDAALLEDGANYGYEHG